MKNKEATDKPAAIATDAVDAEEELKPIQRQSSGSPLGENMAAKMPNLYNYFNL